MNKQYTVPEPGHCICEENKCDSWNIDEVEINVRSDWLRKYERRV